LLHHLIERKGQGVELGRECEGAWNLFKEHSADGIIRDWLFLKVEGPALFRRILEHDGPYSYFILFAAFVDQQHHLTGRKSGADDYLAKPFDMEDLSARMVTAERVITLHRRREALLRLARHIATSTDPSALFATLLDEGLQLSGLEAGFVSHV